MEQNEIGGPWQGQVYARNAFISHFSLLAPGGMQVVDTGTPSLTRLGVHPFQNATLHFIMPTIQAEARFDEEVPTWRQGLAIQGDYTVRQPVDCHLWYPG